MPRNSLVTITFVTLISLLLGSAGCRETPKPPAETPAVTPKTAPVTPAPETQPAATAPSTQPVASRPTEKPIVKPERPKPQYEDAPPYRVVFTIGSPDDPQAGWLHVESLMNDKQEASVDGEFPEANRMVVDTNNVSGLTIDLSMLPMRPRHRIILQIDKQGIDISTKHRGKILLLRGPTGSWKVMTPIPP